MSTTFGLTDAAKIAAHGVEHSLLPKSDGPDFCSWLAGMYDGEDSAYVAGLSVSTLYGRFLYDSCKHALRNGGQS